MKKKRQRVAGIELRDLGVEFRRFLEPLALGQEIGVTNRGIRRAVGSGHGLDEIVVREFVVSRGRHPGGRGHCGGHAVWLIGDWYREDSRWLSTAKGGRWDGGKGFRGPPLEGCDQLFRPCFALVEGFAGEQRANRLHGRIGGLLLLVLFREKNTHTRPGSYRSHARV